MCCDHLLTIQIQFLNTGGGTVRFHQNLYSDGKVCISLLGNSEGDKSERWDPKLSCIGQVLVSIQSLVLGEYDGGVVGQELAKDDYFSYRIATLRYSAIALLQGCRGVGQYAGQFQEFSSIIRAYYLTNRQRLLHMLSADLTALQGMRSSNEKKLKREIAKFIEELRLLNIREECRQSN